MLLDIRSYDQKVDESGRCMLHVSSRNICISATKIRPLFLAKESPRRKRDGNSCSQRSIHYGMQRDTRERFTISVSGSFNVFKQCV
ncbi:hypothetical protein ALC53_03851 [Atta colombica]|uniref:Uncharacterized protein n=1 Tax=Atta colombica TaxID=520822 RepID=A0A195BNC4_9HYME|nr:hypothetical protein ALC53_03851 [Atta colombica]